MSIRDFLQFPGLEVETSFRLRACAPMPFVGKVEVFEVSLTGSLKQEGTSVGVFDVDVEILNRDVIPASLGEVSLDLESVRQALVGETGAFAQVWESIEEQARARGISLPFGL